MLIAVVGPSGAGKDRLMAGARAALAQDTRFRFVRRAITRATEAGGEDHEALTEAAFMARRAVDNVSTVQHQLDHILFKMPKFICVNDNMNHSHPDNPKACCPNMHCYCGKCTIECY